MRPLAFFDLMPWERQLFEKIRAAVGELPDDLDLGADEQDKKALVSCHMLAWALPTFFKQVRCVDGFFLHPGWPHSWLELLPSGHVIDPYPWAIAGGPILVINHANSPLRRFYVEQELAGVQDPAFRARVEKVTAALRVVVDGFESNARSAKRTD